MTLEDILGLHEEIEIIYVVDGYEATLLTGDGARRVRTVKADTVLEAIQGLMSPDGSPGELV